jgi:hypothetical protein
LYKKDNFAFNGKQLPEPYITSNTSDADIDVLAGNVSPDPIDIALNYTLQNYIDAHIKEEAFLLNPYLDDPTLYFGYEADDITKEVTIIPTKPEYAKHIKAAEDYYGINRIELKNSRYECYKIFRILKIFFNTSQDLPLKKQVEKQIKAMLSNKYIFSGMNRFFDKVL